MKVDGTAAEVRLNYATLSAVNMKTQRLFFQPWVDKGNAAGQGILAINPMHGFSVANFTNVYSRVMSNVVQMGWSLQSTLAANSACRR